MLSDIMISVFFVTIVAILNVNVFSNNNNNHHVCSAFQQYQHQNQHQRQLLILTRTSHVTIESSSPLPSSLLPLRVGPHVPLLQRKMAANDNDNNPTDDDEQTTTTKNEPKAKATTATKSPNMEEIAIAKAKKKAQAEKYPAIILEPFLEGLKPEYIVNGPVGQDDQIEPKKQNENPQPEQQQQKQLSSFIISRFGDGPTVEELTNGNLYKIVVRNSTVTDLEVNTLVWKCLGYRFSKPVIENEKEENEPVDDTGKSTITSQKAWIPTNVFPNWKKQYPNVCDFIGMARMYSKDIDEANFLNNRKLTQSVPLEHKQSLKQYLKPLGFSGYKMSELTPNLTRRAQCTNWLLYYREELMGYTIEELRAKRQIKKDQEAAKEKQEQEEQLLQQQQDDDDAGGSKNGGEEKETKPKWVYPGKEVF